MINEKVKIKYSNGITIGIILDVTTKRVTIKSPGLGTITINRNNLRRISSPYRGAYFLYQSFN